GRLMIDAKGRYSLQIFRSERPNFAANDRAKGTDQEMREAVLGASTAIGTMTVDWAAHTMRMNILDGSYPNIRGTTQVRPFTFDGTTLAWRVAKRPDGSVPISVWRRTD
ncbi:MAG TPA: lipocalin-like domain-containing protein, partial [Gemmatimonadales bacterium]|nr:lipocalin-like domain-containing protein [Gemmatimonadales bacterium]